MKLFNKANWTRPAVLGGLGWSYSTMLFAELITGLINDYGFPPSYWRWEVVVIKFLLWTLFGLTFGRWLFLKNRRTHSKN
jgi:hypothetical protein